MPDIGVELRQGLSRLMWWTAALSLGLVLLGTFTFIDARSKSAKLADSLARNHEAILLQHHALSEICRQAHIIQGLLAAENTLVTISIANRGVVPSPALAAALLAYKGYQEALNEQPSCPQVLNP